MVWLKLLGLLFAENETSLQPLRGNARSCCAPGRHHRLIFGDWLGVRGWLSVTLTSRVSKRCVDLFP
jgi:hypothetical protein